MAKAIFKKSDLPTGVWVRLGNLTQSGDRLTSDQWRWRLFFNHITSLTYLPNPKKYTQANNPSRITFAQIIKQSPLTVRWSFKGNVFKQVIRVKDVTQVFSKHTEAIKWRDDTYLPEEKKAIKNGIEWSRKHNLQIPEKKYMMKGVK